MQVISSKPWKRISFSPGTCSLAVRSDCIDENSDVPAADVTVKAFFAEVLDVPEYDSRHFTLTQYCVSLCNGPKVMLISWNVLDEPTAPVLLKGVPVSAFVSCTETIYSPIILFAVSGSAPSYSSTYKAGPFSVSLLPVIFSILKLTDVGLTFLVS